MYRGSAFAGTRSLVWKYCDRNCLLRSKKSPCDLDVSRLICERSVHIAATTASKSRFGGKLFLITIPAGFGLGFMAYEAFVINEKTTTVTLYRKMPLKAISRLWGKMNNMNLPKWLRSPALKFYIWMFGCNIEEAAIEDLKHYKNLGEFFRRPLKPDVRPVNPAYSVTSPADGKILHYGLVDNGHLEQVKGIRYSLHGFLGPTTWSEDTRREAAAPVVVGDDESNANARSISEREYEQSIKTNPENELYHCVIYLAPGDYHRFHSPTEWNVCYRRHFPGELLSVSPGIARWVQGLFNFNERAVYYGSWVHGFFSMTAVGATNVGSIKVNFDEDLVTNCGRRWKEGTYFDRGFTNNNGKGIAIKKGDEFGEFNLGSTIVLIFEAPKDFKFEINEGQKIRYGEPVGCIS
ncbi:phosphatidylserine decarboxylase proenzyme, mitochondrial-like isoform X2 [Tubulanus polymorphus]|uniref:phosphatidylserine decarboxylase proenzyme, mitochondrial-like isoform X2 n=1 Tax=Tubulanus polymorphus TaxID=672921 RepID=UPI003DA6B04D